MPRNKTEPKYAEFGRLLTYWMAERGMAPAELKRRMKIGDGSTVSRWRKGQVRPDGPDLLRLAKVLGVHVNQLSPGFAPEEKLVFRGVAEGGRVRPVTANVEVYAPTPALSRGAMPPEVIMRELDRITGQVRDVLGALAELRALIPATARGENADVGQALRDAATAREVLARSPPAERPG